MERRRERERRVAICLFAGFPQNRGYAPVFAFETRRDLATGVVYQVIIDLVSGAALRLSCKKLRVRCSVYDMGRRCLRGGQLAAGKRGFVEVEVFAGGGLGRRQRSPRSFRSLFLETRISSGGHNRQPEFRLLSACAVLYCRVFFFFFVYYLSSA